MQQMTLLEDITIELTKFPTDGNNYIYTVFVYW